MRDGANTHYAKMWVRPSSKAILHIKRDIERDGRSWDLALCKRGHGFVDSRLTELLRE